MESAVSTARIASQRKYSKGGDGGPIDAREANDHQGDGEALQAHQQGGARPDARRALRCRGRQPAYGPELIAPLAKVWATLGGIWGKRPVAAMARTVSALERHGELELTGEAVVCGRRGVQVIPAPATSYQGCRRIRAKSP